MSGQETFCFSTLPHHPAGRQQSCRTRLCVDKSIEATTPHGPATRLATCVLGVARRYEWSEVARTACGASASDGRSADAWTERAPILRGREGVKDGTVISVEVLTPSVPRSCTQDRARASRATAFRPTVQLRRPRHFDSPSTQDHAYPSRSPRQSSRTRRDEPVSIR